MIKRLTQSRKKFIVIASIFVFPLIVIMFNYLVVTIFNLGNYIGTFLRYVFERVVC